MGSKRRSVIYRDYARKDNYDVAGLAETIGQTAWALWGKCHRKHQIFIKGLVPKAFGYWQGRWWHSDFAFSHRKTFCVMPLTSFLIWDGR
jgi:hypothetical protein